ncbi:MAG: hypothetical protein U0518_03955 [Candidatus Gracilibacteria bacterium]
MLKSAASKLLRTDNDSEESEDIVTHCAWCGKEIHEGDRITLFTDQAMSPRLPMANTVLWRRITPYSAIYVGCTRPSCCESSTDACATWTHQQVMVDVYRGESSCHTMTSASARKE